MHPHNLQMLQTTTEMIAVINISTKMFLEATKQVNKSRWWLVDSPQWLLLTFYSKNLECGIDL